MFASFSHTAQFVLIAQASTSLLSLLHTICYLNNSFHQFLINMVKLAQCSELITGCVGEVRVLLMVGGQFSFGLLVKDVLGYAFIEVLGFVMAL
ncbi:hypothetical protein BC830DRAFT_1119172 [Chytriomyces sp. MP71]|nr:hypothetical protein BC830DRAFT_1119172 [Chytriomyces sp. MP71]